MLVNKPKLSEIIKLNHIKLSPSSEIVDKPIIFLHGLFGSMGAFNLYAKHPEIKKHDRTSYLVDLRNHGGSGRSNSMCYFA